MASVIILITNNRVNFVCFQTNPEVGSAIRVIGAITALNCQPEATTFAIF